MGVSYVKFCPRCQATTSVDSALCPSCGHQFRTHFQPKVSEKTISMTSIPEADRLWSGPGPLQETPQEQRRVVWPWLVLLGVALLTAVGLLHGTRTRPAPPPRVAPAPEPAFQPYAIVIRGNAHGDAVPMATRSAKDLRKWATTQAVQKPASDAATGDDPAHVRLYRSKRIVLVPAGTPGRVLIEQGKLCRVRVDGGLYKGAEGFVSRASVGR